MKAMFIAMVNVLFILSINAAAANASIQQTAAPPKASVINKINLNKADVATLTQSFKGIGKKRAEAIVAYRETHRGFGAIKDLAHVKGIGQAFVEKHMASLKDVFVVE